MLRLVPTVNFLHKMCFYPCSFSQSEVRPPWGGKGELSAIEEENLIQSWTFDIQDWFKGRVKQGSEWEKNHSLSKKRSQAEKCGCGFLCWRSEFFPGYKKNTCSYKDASCCNSCPNLQTKLMPILNTEIFFFSDVSIILILIFNFFHLTDP